jgi:hypothetical protein
MAETGIRAAYDESVRAITQQVGALDELRSRAGTLLAAASLVTSFLGGQALAGPALHGRMIVRATIDGWGWIAIAAFGGVFVLTLIVLWTYNWKFSESPSGLIGIYESMDPVMSLEDAQRELALHLEENYDDNEKRLIWLSRCLRGAATLLTFEAIAWIIDLTK